MAEGCRSRPRHIHGARHGPGGHHGHPRHSHGGRHRPHHLHPAHMSASGPFMGGAPHVGPPMKPHRHPMSSFYGPSSYMAPPPHAVDPQHHNLPLNKMSPAHMAAPPRHAPQHHMHAGSLDPAAVPHQTSYPPFHIRPHGFQLHRTRHNFHQPPAAPAAAGAAHGLERLGNHLHRHRRHQYYPQPPPPAADGYDQYYGGGPFHGASHAEDIDEYGRPFHASRDVPPAAAAAPA